MFLSHEALQTCPYLGLNVDKNVYYNFKTLTNYFNNNDEINDLRHVILKIRILRILCHFNELHLWKLTIGRFFVHAATEDDDLSH